ncbi:unnamed protein product [Symbiodinium necroappetens]|uniref:Saccharopine dehydrogenase NADP binding domain-containing protein n=1 Tax=Symbiodinium necroappetens TaxID=1628268 RepID=A0A812RKD2_9DINO|nr:unnamed protein product [Symbiodinium necroappetens]
MRYLGDSQTSLTAKQDKTEWGFNVGAFGGLRLSLAEEPKPALGIASKSAIEAATAESARRYDVVVLGATGFTGRLMVEHLDALVCSQKDPSKGRKWAIAGRNMQRLRALCSSCRSSPDALAADSDASLEEVASQCTVLIAAAGPYAQCGELAIRACVKSRTHYVDVSGESVWMHEMIQRYHAEAKQRGVLLVQAAAQVCAIDDLNCYLLAQKLGPLKQFREYFFSVGGTTGGTFATSAASMKEMTEEKLRVFQDPFSLGGPSRAPKPEEHDCKEALQDPNYSSLWQQPAYNGHTGGRILRRSRQLFEEASPGSYGDFPVVIRDAATSKRAAEQALKAMAPIESPEQAQVAAQMMQQQVAQGQMPKPGEGPPPETRALFYSEVFALGEGEDGRWAHVHYTGPEAYEVTAMAAVTGALVIVEEQEAIQPAKRGGIVTPAFAFHGTSYVQRLEANAFAAKAGRKMSFKVVEGKPTEDSLKDAITRKTKSAVQGQADMSAGKLWAWA